MRDREGERQRHRQREKQAPGREPDAGLDPGAPRSHPEPRVEAPSLSPLGVPISGFNVRIFSCRQGRSSSQRPLLPRVGPAMSVRTPWALL